ncbi:MAG: LysM peptidoglycan-binding domain-containing protein [Bacilli bacterium]|nr:LysM peptidoglycan-binding domain-containing protein [Bacilli bacterium]
MFDKYSIKKGESLENVAKMFNTDVDVLKQINNIYYDDMVRAGMDIIVPKNRDQYFNYYVIEKGDNLYEIARKYNINPELLASMNGLEMDDYIYPNQELLIPKSGYSYYITKDGDTLEMVSDVFRVNKDELMNDNSTIYLMPGQIMVKKNR